MGSKLSSLLVKEQLVPVKALEDALALQAIRGGALDTILLERRLVAEPLLSAALSHSSGYPALDPELLLFADAATAGELGAELALRHGMCPVGIADGEIILLVPEQTDQVELDELGFDIGRRFRPVVAPEVRIRQAQQKVYGKELDARFVKLLHTIGTVPPDPAELPTAERHPAPAAASPELERPSGDNGAPAAQAGGPSESGDAFIIDRKSVV